MLINMLVNMLFLLAKPCKNQIMLFFEKRSKMLSSIESRGLIQIKKMENPKRRYPCSNVGCLFSDA